MKANSWQLIVTGLISAFLYGYFFYWIDRNDSLEIALCYSLLFIGFIYFLKIRQQLNTKTILGLAIVFRLISLFAIPNLSDDFYRFIWDGLVWSQGINPFAYTPQMVIEQDLFQLSSFGQQVYAQLNSQSTYTVYPTIPQFINLLGITFFRESLLGNIIVMRLFILMAEGLTFYFLIKIIKARGINSAGIMVYALNPLVIIELTGNLHHEAYMIAFFQGFVYLSQQKKVISSTLLLAMAIGSKLLPLMFVPYIFLKEKSKTIFTLTLILSLVMLFLPLADQSFFVGMKSSLSLYYQRFEFNAGLYYLFRQIGYWYYNYNAIALIGKLFFFFAISLIGLVSYVGFRRKTDELVIYTLIYLVFALFSLILHPWYILFLVALAPMLKARYSIVWSFLIFFTYLGYNPQGFTENYWIVGLEYTALLIAVYLDWKNQAF